MNENGTPALEASLWRVHLAGMGHRPNGNGYTGQDWCATVGGMLRHGTAVRATCDKCGVCLEVDLAPLLMRLGPAGTLLNRRPPCRVVGCTGKMLFSATPGGGTPYMPCLTRDR